MKNFEVFVKTSANNSIFVLKDTSPNVTLEINSKMALGVNCIFILIFGGP